MKIDVLLVSALLVAGYPKPKVVQQAATVSHPNLAQVPPALPALELGGSMSSPWVSKASTSLDNVTLRKTSLDGRFDLVVGIIWTGRPAVALASHEQYDALVKNLFALKEVGPLHTRIEFDDGSVTTVDWGEWGDSVNNLLAFLPSYPAVVGEPLGLLPKKDWSHWSEQKGGDSRLVRDLLAHKQVLFEIKPGLTAQFDLTGLPQAYAAAKTQQKSMSQGGL